MNSFVITTSVRGSQRSQIWDASSPLPLGHPFQWMIERTERGIRVRALAPRMNEVISSRDTGLQEIPFDRLGEGAELELPRADSIGRDAVKLRIRAVREQAPAYDVALGNQLAIYACAGHWVLRSDVLNGAAEKPYAGKFQGKTAFTIAKSASGYRITSARDDLKVCTASSAPTLPGKQHLDLSATDMIRTTIRLATTGGGEYVWRFGLTSNPAFVEKTKGYLSPLDESEAIWFRNALRGTFVALAAFVALSWVWPKPAPETELIPPQVAKLLLTPPKQKASTGSAPSAENTTTKETKNLSPSEKVQKKVKDTAVVQAFRAKALSNAVSGLLKGGMTQLLAQSDFVMGKEASAEARRIFDSRSESMRATGPNVGMLTDRKVNVAGLGGEGGSHNGKGHAGYGKGEHAAVGGQGEAFVGMDAPGASVDEGLTKDEVGEVIHRHLREVRYCYESAMLRTPDIEGKLMTAFVIGANGKVKSADVKTSTLPDPRLDDCILRRLATWQFPNPRGGIDVAVSYPFIFKTLGR